MVISGAEQSIQAQWGLGAGVHGIVMASALYGTVLGSLIGGWPTDRFGRKPTLLFIGILYIVGAIGSALANDPFVFIAARVIGGLGIGISTVAECVETQAVLDAQKTLAAASRREVA